MAYRKVQPTLLLSPRSNICDGVLGELALLVKDLREVDENGRGLKDTLAIVGDSGDTPVGVDLEEPRRLDLVVYFANVSVANGHLHRTSHVKWSASSRGKNEIHALIVRRAVYCLELLEENGRGVAVRCTSRVENNGFVRLVGHRVQL